MMKRKQSGSGDAYRCDDLAASGRTASASPWALALSFAQPIFQIRVSKRQRVSVQIYNTLMSMMPTVP